jgi:hypothetical protein
MAEQKKIKIRTDINDAYKAGLKFWHMGSLITKEEHDKLTPEQVQESKAWERGRLKERKSLTRFING